MESIVTHANHSAHVIAMIQLFSLITLSYDEPYFYCVRSAIIPIFTESAIINHGSAIINRGSAIMIGHTGFAGSFVSYDESFNVYLLARAT